MPIDRFDAEYYDEKYFADKQGKTIRHANGSTDYWGYRNPDGEFLGAKDICKAWKEVFKPTNMLDVGAGRGTFIAYARDLGIEAVGFDFSEWAIKNPYHRVKPEWLIQHDATKHWPYPDESFDLVVCLDLLEHIYLNDLEFVISELRRVTKRYMFLQIAVAGDGQCKDCGNLPVRQREEGYILKKGEPVPPGLEGCAAAGHVTVRRESFWLDKLVNEDWLLRKDMLHQFCGLVKPEIIKNWLLNSIIILERL